MKLIIYAKGKQVGTIAEIRGRLRATQGTAAGILEGVRSGSILLAGEKIEEKNIFSQLPDALDGAYLAAELVE